MELPNKYKKLYKHWSFHTLTPSSTTNTVKYDKNVLTKIKQLVDKRIKIWELKENNAPKPYTDDPILATYRFCNIYREFDRQTVFFHEFYKALEGDFSMWLLNILFARSICDTNTVEKLGHINFDTQTNNKLCKQLKELPSPKYGTAYVFPISAIQSSKWNTREKFFCLYYPHVIKRVADIIQTFDRVSVTKALQAILPLFGFNLKFLWTEVLIDVAYQFPQYIDLYKEFPIGPGAKPTMKSLNDSLLPEQVNLSLLGKFDKELNLPTINGQPIYLSAENWEGIGCEFRKYTNLRNNTGRKRRYS